MSGPSSVRQVKAGWGDVVLVCRKCCGKLEGGFGRKSETSFVKALRRAAMPRAARKAKLRRAPLAVIEVGCLGVCPKNAVVTLRAGAPGRWLVVPRGTAMPQVMTDLGLTADAVDSPVSRT